MLKPSIAEAIATFALVLVAAGATIIDAHVGGSLGLVGIAFAHFLVLAVAISATMGISGAHINPAVTIGLLTMGKIPLPQAIAYIVAQLIGAALAGFFLKLTFPVEAVELTRCATPALAEGISVGQGFVLEAVATLLLAFGIYGTAVSRKAPPGIAAYGIGMTVAFLIIVFGPLTGAAMNPARHFGSAVAAGFFENIWLYWVATILGSVLGFQLFRRILD